MAALLPSRSHSKKRSTLGVARSAPTRRRMPEQRRPWNRALSPLSGRLRRAAPVAQTLRRPARAPRRARSAARSFSTCLIRSASLAWWGSPAASRCCGGSRTPRSASPSCSPTTTLRRRGSPTRSGSTPPPRCSYDLELLTEAQLRQAAARVPAEQYQEWFAALPAKNQREIEGRWGAPPGDAYVAAGRLRAGPEPDLPYARPAPHPPLHRLLPLARRPAARGLGCGRHRPRRQAWHPGVAPR